MSPRSISCCIAIYPPPGIHKKAIDLSRRLKQGGGLFVLDGKRYYPHVTLYMSEFPVQNLGVMKTALKRIAAATRSFTLRPVRYRLQEAYVDISFRRTGDVLRLHRTVVRVLSPLREGLIRPKDLARLHQFSKAKRRNLQKYGYDNIHSQFLPHLTFTKLRRELKNVLQRLPRYDFSFQAERIALFRSAAHGTCRKLIAQFKFGR